MDKEISQGFPRKVRIVRASEYRMLYKAGKKVHSKRFVLFGRMNGLENSRLGITVSRKVGGAVVRNRVKRLFREIFRKSLGDIPSRLDVVVNAKPGCAETSYGELRIEFLDAMKKLAI